jgi:2-oxoglutarate dehydrogenase complex dehydrogenase (E1) component-like enzyme
MDITDEAIRKLVEQHKRKLEYYKNKYHNERKYNEEFMEKNRQRSRNHYERNKEAKKEYYLKNRDFMNAKNSYNYYKKRENIEKFKTKFPDKYQLLIDREYIKL